MVSKSSLGGKAGFPGCLHSGLRWTHVLSRVCVCVCIRISPARSQADPGVCLSAVFGLGRCPRKEAVHVRGPASSSSTGRQTQVFSRTHTQRGCRFVFVLFFSIFVSAMPMTAMASLVYISVSGNDSYWLRSHLARLHLWAGLQWVSPQMCHRQFTAAAPSDFPHLTSTIMRCGSA